MNTSYELTLPTFKRIDVDSSLGFNESVCDTPFGKYHLRFYENTSNNYELLFENELINSDKDARKCFNSFYGHYENILLKNTLLKKVEEDEVMIKNYELAYGDNIPYNKRPKYCPRCGSLLTKEDDNTIFFDKYKDIKTIMTSICENCHENLI